VLFLVLLLLCLKQPQLWCCGAAAGWIHIHEDPARADVSYCCCVVVEVRSRSLSFTSFGAAAGWTDTLEDFASADVIVVSAFVFQVMLRPVE
jgi:hypothetical protein